MQHNQNMRECILPGKRWHVSSGQEKVGHYNKFFISDELAELAPISGPWGVPILFTHFETHMVTAEATIDHCWLLDGL